MAFEEELVALLAEGTPVATLGTNLFFGSSSEIPTGPGPYLHVIITGGFPPIRFQNNVTQPFVRPGAQIVARAKVYATARTMAYNAYRALAGVRNRTVSGVFYREINPVQEPFDNGLDDAGRIQFVFNIVAVKNPS